MEPEAPKTIHKYEVLDLIGRDAWGCVYKAMDRSLDRLVAIKIVADSAGDDPELLKRFQREAQFAANLHHPNIVAVYDLGDLDGKPYLVMEYMAGQSLEAMLARQPMSLLQRIGYVRQVCSGLQYAHTRQPSIMHGNLTPASIVVLDVGTPKIVDFAIARLSRSRDGSAGPFMGSYHYMSPEQISNGELDGRSDIFSLGVILYQLLTLTPPFEGGGIASTLQRIVNSQPAPLNEFLREYPARLDDIVGKALAKKRHSRYQQASEFAFDLQEVENELKQEIYGSALDHAESLLAKGDLEQARERLGEVEAAQLTRAKHLMREVQDAISRKGRARTLRTQAEAALKLNRIDEARTAVDQAVQLNSTDTDLQRFREEVIRLQEQAAKTNEILGRAEQAYSAGDFTEALRIVNEALSFDPASARALSFQSILQEKVAERKAAADVDEIVSLARQQIAQSRYTDALALLQRASQLRPNLAEVRDLTAKAESGRQAQSRANAIEQEAAEISSAIAQGDLTGAVRLTDRALQRFPNDQGLLSLRSVAQQKIAAQREKQARLSSQRPVPDASVNDVTLDAIPAFEEGRTPSNPVRPPAAEPPNQRPSAQRPAIPESKASSTPSVEHAPRRTAPPPVPSAEVVSQSPLRPTAPPAPPVETSLVPEGQLAAAESQLAKLVGPLARILIRKAAARATSIAELYDFAAAGLERPSDREAFLAFKPGAAISAAPAEQSVARVLPVQIPQAELDRASRLLAQFVGPLAGVFVRKAQQRSETLQAFYSTLAQHVESEPDRTHFLRALRFPNF